MPLKLSLRDGEKIVINGTVMRSIGRTEISVETPGQILRGRDIMPPEAATTPCRRLYFHTMMAYVDQENVEQHQQRIVDALAEVTRTCPGPETMSAAIEFAERVATFQYYKALASCKKLMELNEENGG